MKINRFLISGIAAMSLVLASCSGDDGPAPVYPVSVSETVPSGATIKSLKAIFTEINTGETTTLTSLTGLSLAAGTYDIEAEAIAEADGIQKTLRAAARNVVINESTGSISLDWFYFTPGNSLVFSKIFVAGSLKADGKSCLYDSYFCIYNNTDEVIYADGLLLCESKLINSQETDLRTEANMPENNFTVQTLYAIPGTGTDVPVQPGKYIKIADQAINFNDPAAGLKGQDNTDADFEWYDEVNVGTIRDTDNPSVPNLVKVFSYSKTIWLPNQQCNKSYALVRLPEGMTFEQYLSQYNGEYDYVGVTGKDMKGTNCYLVPNDWIIDGVSLCPTSKFKHNWLAPSVDISYASVAEDSSVGNRAGKVFVRKVAGTSPAGNTILQDTNDSANDFEIVSLY